MTAATEIIIIVWASSSLVAVGLPTAHLLRTAGRRMQSRAHGGDSELHRRRAETEAVAEEHDIDDMLDAIAAFRRGGGRPDIGQELARELVRNTYDGWWTTIMYELWTTSQRDNDPIHATSFRCAGKERYPMALFTTMSCSR